MKNVLKHLFDPKVVIPTLLSAALLVFVLTFAGPGQVGSCLLQALAGAWLPALGLAVVVSGGEAGAVAAVSGPLPFPW